MIEIDVSIICSSMPAFASLSRSYVTKSRNIASLRDRFASYLAVSKTKLGSGSKSIPHLKSSRSGEDHSDSVTQLHVGQYSSLKEGGNTSMAVFPSVLTKIRATSPGNLEEGIIMQSSSLEQLTQKA